MQSTQAGVTTMEARLEKIEKDFAMVLHSWELQQKTEQDEKVFWHQLCGEMMAIKNEWEMEKWGKVQLGQQSVVPPPQVLSPSEVAPSLPGLVGSPVPEDSSSANPTVFREWTQKEHEAFLRNPPRTWNFVKKPKQHKPFGTVAFATGDVNRNVGMIGGNSTQAPLSPPPVPLLGMLGGGSIFANTLLKHPPTFSGRLGDWSSFQQEWEGYLNVLRGLTGGANFPDQVLLEVLKASLDESSKQMLQREREKNSQLTYAEFWRKMQDEFLGDETHQHRLAWQRVKLDKKGPITTKIWRKFRRCSSCAREG